MPEFPFAYEKIAPTTWAYLSSLLMLALFFKFNRFWSFRNVDLILIVLLAPGLLLVDFGNRGSYSSVKSQTDVARQSETASLATDNGETISNDNPPSTGEEQIDNGDDANVPTDRPRIRWSRTGYYWLLSMSVVFLIRMLIDPLLVRRPLLAPNLSVGGLVFLMCVLLTFLFANIITANPTADDVASARSAIKMIQREAAAETETADLAKRGPGFPLFQLFPIIPTFSSGQELLAANADEDRNIARYATASKTLAIVSQSFLVLGLVLIGTYLFNDTKIGFAMATIYLLLPYTSQYTGHLMHVLPGALLVWAVVCFRRSPFLAGLFIGLATGVAYYPLFLLPLWASYYWESGAKRFFGGVLLAIVVCIGTLIFTSVDIQHFFQQLAATFGFWIPRMKGLDGIWGLGWDSAYRLPILVAFVALCISFVFWPTTKNVGTLIAYSCAIMVGVQLWHGFEGGLIMAWYLPLALATIFRPNLEGTTAKAELNRSRMRVPESEQALLLDSPAV